MITWSRLLGVTTSRYNSVCPYGPGLLGGMKVVMFTRQSGVGPYPCHELGFDSYLSEN